MHNPTDITSKIDNGPEIIEALTVYDLVNRIGQEHYSQLRYTHAHSFDPYAETQADAEKRADEAVEAEKALYETGKRYYEAGYRLKYGERQQFGIAHDIPDEALAWRLVPADFIAGTEAYRLQCLTQVTSEVMTPAQIERAYGLASGSVRNMLASGNIPHSRPDGRTILIPRDYAEKRWSNPELVMRVEMYINASSDYPEDVREAYGHKFYTVDEALDYLSRYYGGSVEVLRADHPSADDTYYPVKASSPGLFTVEKPFSLLDRNGNFDITRFGDVAAQDYATADDLMDSLASISLDADWTTQEQVDRWNQHWRSDEKGEVALWWEAATCEDND